MGILSKFKEYQEKRLKEKEARFIYQFTSYLKGTHLVSGETLVNLGTLNKILIYNLYNEIDYECVNAALIGITPNNHYLLLHINCFSGIESIKEISESAAKKCVLQYKIDAYENFFGESLDSLPHLT